MLRNDPRLHPTRDHIVPHRLGGRKTVVVCYDCNNRKGGLLPGEWLWVLGRVRPERVGTVQELFVTLGVPVGRQRPVFWRGMPEEDRLAAVAEIRKYAEGC
jgi:hypothetical protein